MGLVVGFVVVGLVVALAVFVVMREVSRLRADPPDPIFDEDEVFDWVVEHLPDIVAATLTTDDVRRILGFQVELFRRRGVSVQGDTSVPVGPVVVGGSEIIDSIVERCAATGEAYLPEQVQGVIETQFSYLRAIGAVGPQAPPDEDI
ncbi:MAG TPA: hypothetical protein VFF40_02880 [Acidimicrobiia bacterium]|nr:hypothetical protein [Acidimicrobiia bacterium]